MNEGQTDTVQNSRGREAVPNDGARTTAACSVRLNQGGAFVAQQPHFIFHKHNNLNLIFKGTIIKNILKVWHGVASP